MVLLTPLVASKVQLSQGFFISTKMGESLAEDINMGRLKLNSPVVPVHLPYDGLSKNYYGKHDQLKVDVSMWREFGLPELYKGESLSNKKLIIFPMHGLGDQLYLAIAIRNLARQYPNLEITIVKSGISAAEQWYHYIYFERFLNTKGPLVTTREMKAYDYFTNAEHFAHCPEYPGTYPPDFYIEHMFHHSPETLKDKRPKIGPLTKSVYWDNFFKELKQSPLPIVFVNPVTTGRVRDIPQKTTLDFAELASRKYTLIISTFKNPDLDRNLNSLGEKNIITTQHLIKDVSDLICIVQKADIILTTDSGITHIAEALDTPCATIFNVVTPEERVRPYLFSDYAMIEFELAGVCRAPCYVHALEEDGECPGMSFVNQQAGKRIFWDYPPCMENLKGEHLFQLLEETREKFRAH
jgi:ADP-heptose:LPS heptosyltransferase